MVLMIKCNYTFTGVKDKGPSAIQKKDAKHVESLVSHESFLLLHYLVLVSGVFFTK